MTDNCKGMNTPPPRATLIIMYNYVGMARIPQMKLIQPHSSKTTLSFLLCSTHKQQNSCIAHKQRCRDRVINDFLSWSRHLLVPLLFHEVTSLHPPSFQRNDFSTCYTTGTSGIYSVNKKTKCTGYGSREARKKQD